MSLIIVNPTDSHYYENRYIIAFGAYGWTKLLVWAKGIDDALNKCIDWLVDNYPGIIIDAAVEKAYETAIQEGCDEYQAYERATVDTTYGGNNGHYLNSWEWQIVAENPDRATIKQLQGEP